MDISLFEAFVLGVVQALAEFLPISSSGHLILVPWLLGWPEHGLTFDLALHLGTSAALLGYFWREWVALVGTVLAGLTSVKARQTQEWRLAWYIVIGCIPAGIIGVLFEDVVEAMFRQAWLIAVFLILFGLLLFIADRLGRRERMMGSLTLTDAIVIGVAQALALMPGVSRSGITLTAGLFRGLDREAAARFSFLLSAPITIAAALFKLGGLLTTPPTGSEILLFVVGGVTAAVVGALAISFLLRYLQYRSVTVFVVYRVVVGTLVLGFALAGR